MPSIINAATSGGLISTADTSGVLQLQTASTTALTITAAQNVGIGLTSPSTKLQLSGSGTQTFRITSTDGANADLSCDGTSSMSLGSPNGIPIRFVTNGTERLRIPQDAGGIQFPATQVASSNANTLDDYEEGTWTPTYSLGSGSGTFTTGTAVYTKIGRVVTLAIRFVGSGVSSASNLAIGGLPFPFANSNADSSGGFREYTTLGNLYILSFGSSTDVQMQRYDNNNGLPNGGPGFSGSFTYTTNT